MLNSFADELIKVSFFKAFKKSIKDVSAIKKDVQEMVASLNQSSKYLNNTLSDIEKGKKLAKYLIPLAAGIGVTGTGGALYTAISNKRDKVVSKIPLLNKLNQRGFTNDE